MPPGDAARIHEYAGELVRKARAQGEPRLTICVGDVRSALELDYSDAAIDICQVLETYKFQAQAGVKFLSKKGPKQGVSTIYRFLVIL